MATAQDSTLTSTLNRPVDPFSLVGQLNRTPGIRQRGEQAVQMEEDVLRQQSQAAEQLKRAEAEARKAQITKEESVEKDYLRGMEAAQAQRQAAMVQQPERTITAFNAEKGLELAALTAILGGFAGKISGGAGLKAMEGISQGFREGQEDLYKREVANYEAEVAKYKQKVEEAKMIYDDALKLEQAKRGAGLVELKKLEPLLQDSVITAHVRNNDWVSTGKAIEAALKVRDQIEMKMIEAGITKATQGPSLTEVVDPQDPTRMLRVDARIYKGGTLGSVGVFGISGKVPASEAAASQKKEGQRRFEVLLGSLEKIYTDLRDKGAITDTQASVAQNFGAYLATTAPVQIAQRAYGGTSQELRDRIQALRASLIQAIMASTGMSQRSLDSNKELEFYLTAATDPTKSFQANIEGMRVLRQMYGKMKDNVDSEQVQEAAISTFGAYEPQKFAYSLTPDNKVIRSPLTDSMSGAGQGQQVSDQDRAALEWLRQNPNDPRAPQIRERLQAKGVQ